MKNIPTLVKVAIGFILAGAGVWLVLGVLIAARLHQGMPSDPLIRWGMAIAAFVAFLVMGTLAWLLAKRKRLAFFITLVALGTSVPELASSIVASFKEQSGLVVGTVIGANVANMLLITGIAAAFAAIGTRRVMIERDGFIMLATTALFCLFAWNGSFSRFEAAAMLLVYVVYALFLFTAKAGLEEQYGFRQFLNYLFRFQYVLTIKDGVFAGIGRRKAATLCVTASCRRTR